MFFDANSYYLKISNKSCQMIKVVALELMVYISLEISLFHILRHLVRFLHFYSGNQSLVQLLSSEEVRASC